MLSSVFTHLRVFDSDEEVGQHSCALLFCVSDPHLILVCVFTVHTTQAGTLEEELSQQQERGEAAEMKLQAMTDTLRQLVDQVRAEQSGECDQCAAEDGTFIIGACLISAILDPPILSAPQINNSLTQLPSLRLRSSASALYYSSSSRPNNSRHLKHGLTIQLHLSLLLKHLILLRMLMCPTTQHTQMMLFLTHPLDRHSLGVLLCELFLN